MREARDKWQKASLPVSKGELGLCSAPLHAPAAYLDSSLRSASLVEGLLGRSPPPSIFLDETVSAIASRPDWQTLNDIDVPSDRDPSLLPSMILCLSVC